MEKKQNNAYLLRQWALVVILWIILLFGFSRLIRQGNYLPIIVFIAITAVAIAGWVAFKTLYYVLKRGFQTSPLLEHFMSDKRLGAYENYIFMDPPFIT